VYFLLCLKVQILAYRICYLVCKMYEKVNTIPDSGSYNRTVVFPSMVSIFSKEEKIQQFLGLIKNPEVRPFVEKHLIEVLP